MLRTPPFVPAALAVLLSAGCTTTTAVVVPIEPAILVEREAHVLVLRSAAETRRLADFLWIASDGRLDALHVTVVGLHPALRHAVARSVRGLGVEPSKTREAHGSAGASGAVRVVAVRYRAHPPHCPPLVATGPSFNENDFQPTLGCSDLANLALQVSDPRDLIGNPAVPAVDGERAAIPVARYRQFGAAPGGGAGTSSPTTSASSGATR